MLTGKRFAVVAALLLIGLAACGKKDEIGAGADTETAADTASIADDTLLGEAKAKGQERTQQAALPQPDLSKPLTTYPELKSGQQVMFLYAAAAKLPPDFEKMAQTFSSEYRQTSDAFRRNDLMLAIKPQIEQQIAAAAANPYAWIDLNDADLGSYDFERKGFPVGEFRADHHRYFRDAYQYSYTWANRAQLDFAPVADEALARQIEGMRSKWNTKPGLKIFFFAQSADLNNQRIQALVTRVQITDRQGRVLVEYSPQ